MFGISTDISNEELVRRIYELLPQIPSLAGTVSGGILDVEAWNTWVSSPERTQEELISARKASKNTIV